MVIIKKLSLLGCPAQVLRIEVTGNKAQVTYTPGLKTVNFSANERRLFLLEVARLVTIHKDWPRWRGQPKKPRKIADECTQHTLVYQAGK